MWVAHYMAAGFLLRKQTSERVQMGAQTEVTTVCKLISKATHHSFWHILFLRSKSQSTAQTQEKGYEPSEAGIIWVLSEGPHHTGYSTTWLKEGELSSWSRDQDGSLSLAECNYKVLYSGIIFAEIFDKVFLSFASLLSKAVVCLWELHCPGSLALKLSVDLTNGRHQWNTLGRPLPPLLPWVSPASRILFGSSLTS